MAKFVWRIEVGGIQHEQAVQVRVDHASAQGVPLPENWKAAGRCIGLPAKAAEAAKTVQQDMALDVVDCVLLGQPKPSPLPDPVLKKVPGALVNLSHEGAAQDFLLVAHIVADQWFCHGGGPADDLFNPDGLCVQDIALAATQKARRKSTKTTDLRTKAISSPESWSACVAYATWRGEVMRADGCPLNMASAGFEANPFLWTTDDWLSHAEVTFAWSWLVGGEWLRELVHARADYGVLLPETLRVARGSLSLRARRALHAQQLLLYSGCAKHSEYNMVT